MLELAFIREHTDEVRQAIRDLNTSAPIDEILSLDEQRRSMLSEIEALRARRNAVSKEVPKIKEKDEKQVYIEENDNQLILPDREKLREEGEMGLQVKEKAESGNGSETEKRFFPICLQAHYCVNSLFIVVRRLGIILPALQSLFWPPAPCTLSLLPRPFATCTFVLGPCTLSLDP